VLLLGESGTGKELLANAIHMLGPASGAPCVAVNVTAYPATLIESILFGHERGAFTDARERHQGFFETAGEGTLFLDEIGDLEMSLQVKLLRAIEDRRFYRLGSVTEIPFRARLVCATHRDLAASVANGTFRHDLYHRIAETTINIPPLRERRGDLELLLNHFLDVHRGTRKIRLARESLTILRSYLFPGNIRELENIVKSAVIQCEAEAILPRHLPLPSMAAFLPSPAAAPGPEIVSDSLPADLLAGLRKALPAAWIRSPYRDLAGAFAQAFDYFYFPRKLHQFHHNITRAAKDAGMDEKTFRKHWEECGLPPLKRDNGPGDGGA
jgi:DNA-binding NtrC family response regulator